MINLLIVLQAVAGGVALAKFGAAIGAGISVFGAAFGIGKIGSTLLKRIMTTNALGPDEIMIFDINDTVLKKYADQFNIAAAKSNVDLARSVKYVLLAVLPQVIDKVLTEICY